MSKNVFEQIKILQSLFWDLQLHKNAKNNALLAKTAKTVYLFWNVLFLFQLKGDILIFHKNVL